MHHGSHSNVEKKTPPWIRVLKEGAELECYEFFEDPPLVEGEDMEQREIKKMHHERYRKKRGSKPPMQVVDGYRVPAPYIWLVEKNNLTAN